MIRHRLEIKKWVSPTKKIRFIVTLTTKKPALTKKFLLTDKLSNFNEKTKELNESKSFIGTKILLL